MSKNIRQIRVAGNIAYVPLTRGYEAVIDADDVQLVSGMNWYACVTPWTVYPARKIRGSTEIRMYNVLIADKPTGFVVDHIDCNGLNNLRSNLRLATPSQNQHNKRRQKNNKSGLKGVSFDKKNKKWLSCICLNGRRYNLGRYQTPEQAHEAYRKAADDMHGHFSRPV